MHNNLFSYAYVACNQHIKPNQILQISLAFPQAKAKAQLGHIEIVKGKVTRKYLDSSLQQI